MKISVREISQRLAANPEGVATMLLPGARVHGGMLECGDVSGTPGKSLKVYLQGEKAGRWADYAGTEKGDLLDLWAATRNLTLPEAIRQAKEWLGIQDEEPMRTKTFARPPAEHAELDAKGKAMNWLVDTRKIPPAIVNRFKVRGCGVKKAIVFPSYSPKGELVNHSYRTLTAEKKVWQDAGCAPSLWGWQGISAAAWEKREILICEGQIDAMSWAAWGIDAVSIPNGGGRTWIEYDWDNLEAFTTIFLSFDMDGKSDENLRETINRLGKHRCRVVRIPEKDANDALRAGRTAAEAAQWVATAEYPAMPLLCSAMKFEAQVLERFFPTRDDAEGWSLDITNHRDARKTFRFRNGEFTLWTGTTGHGKSTLLNFAAMMLAIHCVQPALIVSLETLPTENIYRLMSGMQMARQNHAAVSASLATLSKIVLFYDKIGHIAENELLDVMTYAHARHGVRDIVIDSLMRVDGMEEDYPRQTAFSIRLVTFARETGCRVHLVAHPRKSAGDDSPRSQDISGSGNIRNNADNVLVLWRNIAKERKIEDGDESADVQSMPDAVLSIEKDRINGEFRKFPLKFLSGSYRYEPAPPSAKTAQSQPPRKRYGKRY